MNDRSVGQQDSVSLSISAVERDTGISKDTLRVWERRYGYPKPGRDQFGERAYSLEQVDKLRLLRRLLDQGHRPGRIIRLRADQLLELAEQVSSQPASALDVISNQPLDHLLGLLRAHRVDELRRELSQLVLRLGIEKFVTEVAAPLNRVVGDAWSRGMLEVFEEHLYTESMQVVMRNSISSIPASNQNPRILLTTFPNEPHGLGLLMAEALLALEGCQCYSLGCETPVGEIVRAAQSQAFDIIALSFTACLNANQIAEGLAELRSGLPAVTQIWAGGYCPVLQRKKPPGVQVMPTFDDVASAVGDWRADFGA